MTHVSMFGFERMFTIMMWQKFIQTLPTRVLRACALDRMCREPLWVFVLSSDRWNRSHFRPQHRVHLYLIKNLGLRVRRPGWAYVHRNMKCGFPRFYSILAHGSHHSYPFCADQTGSEDVFGVIVGTMLLGICFACARLVRWDSLSWGRAGG